MGVLRLIAAVALVEQVYGGRVCSYSCESGFPNSYGFRNFGTSLFHYPTSRVSAFTPASLGDLCDSPTEFTEDNVPVVVQGAGSDYLAALCSEGVNLFSVDGGFLEKLDSFPLEADTGFLVSQGLGLTVASGRSLIGLRVGDDGKFKKSLEFQSEFSASGQGFKSSHFFYGSFGSVLVEVDSRTGDSKSVQTNFQPSLKYIVGDYSRIIYFCSDSNIVRVDMKTEEIRSQPLGGECSHVLINAKKTILVSVNHENGGSSILELNSNTLLVAEELGRFELFGINGISRSAWGTFAGEVAYLALATDVGIKVLIEKHPRYERGTFHSEFNTTEPITTRPSFTSEAEPFVFIDTNNIIGYTEEYLVKFFDTSFQLADFNSDDYDFLHNGIMFNNKVALGITTNGKAVLYKKCNRFTVGAEELPEDPCPVGELPDTEDVPFWMLIGAGAGTFLFAPVIGSTIMNKMKIWGHDEEELEDVELWSDEDDSDADERPVVRQRKTQNLMPIGITN